MNREQIGAYVKDKRIAMNLTQTQLATEADVGYQRILEIEKVRRSYSVEVLMQVLSALGCELNIAPIESVRITNVKYKFAEIKSADESNQDQVNNFNQIKKEENEIQVESEEHANNHLIIGRNRIIV